MSFWCTWMVMRVSNFVLSTFVRSEVTTYQRVKDVLLMYVDGDEGLELCPLDLCEVRGHNLPGSRRCPSDVHGWWWESRTLSSRPLWGQRSPTYQGVKDVLLMYMDGDESLELCPLDLCEVGSHQLTRESKMSFWCTWMVMRVSNFVLSTFVRSEVTNLPGSRRCPSDVHGWWWESRTLSSRP